VWQAARPEGATTGWSAHHFVMGGAVRGGRFWGTQPEVSVDGADGVGQDRLLPTASVDQLAATLANWMGVADSEMPLVVPQVGNHTTRNLGPLA